MISEIESALDTLRASLPDAAQLMRHGEAHGWVLASSSRDLSGDSLNPSEGAREMRRVIARRADFPALSQGDAVEVENALSVVTSLRADPVGASLTVGLSAVFTPYRVVYTGKRTGKTASSGASTVPSSLLYFTVPVLALEDTALPAAYEDAAAFRPSPSWSVAIPLNEWREPTPPQAGDELRFDTQKHGAPIRDMRLKVASAVQTGGVWLLRARPRGAQ